MMRFLYILLIVSGLPLFGNAHQTPNTIILLDISPSSVAVELQLPIAELELAFGHDISKHPELLTSNLNAQFKEYLLAHIHPMTAKDNPWLVTVIDMQVQPAIQSASGPFQEITVHLILKPQQGFSTRQFIFDYDVILHQVATHSALVSIRNDWNTGKYDAPPIEVGVIKTDTRTNLIYPLQINLEAGSFWKGFASMISLGKQHIADGADHLLFLLALLLPAPLLPSKKKWLQFGGIKYTLIRLLKVVTAFTIGHSITLFIGALKLINIPSAPIEILIAFSILVSAIHAIKPIFPGKESWIAIGFGLIHGLAFAGTLTNLNLDATHTVLSILGFNIGIELMQLFVIAVTVPWLIILSRTSFYPITKLIGATLAIVASIAWMIERCGFNISNVTYYITQTIQYAPWILLWLACYALLGWFWERKSIK